MLLLLLRVGALSGKLKAPPVRGADRDRGEASPGGWRGGVPAYWRA